jgi:galactose mutarotase-like enzyme
METVDYHGHTLARWRVGKSTFLALPERGARLINWNLTLGDGSVRDVIYWPENADFSQFPKIRGGNPILFPFSARTFDQGEQNHWRAADGVRRPMPQHGFARQGTFKLLREDARGFAAQLVPDDEARAAYPFDYEFTVIYRFEPFGLSCEFTLKNLGSTPLPWSPGHHFYFTVPWSEGTTRDDYSIRIPASERWRAGSKGELIPGPALQPIERLSQPDLVDTFHTGLRSNEVVFGERGRPGDVIVKIGPQKVPAPDATIVTWTAATDSPFYCVEPWMGPANAPEHHRGLQLVEPDQTATFVVSVAVK